jgi:hypothetical protein
VIPEAERYIRKRPESLENIDNAWVAEQVDARDLKSLGALSLYEFKSRPRHQQALKNGALRVFPAAPFFYVKTKC